MNDFFVTIYASRHDWMDGDDGVAIQFPNCDKEEIDWLVGFCAKHNTPITIAILPEGDEDGNR